MNNIQRRFLLFLVGCIGFRSLLVYISKTTNKFYLMIIGYLLLIPSIGFFYIYFTNSRQTGIEVFGDKIWWNNLRPIHGLLYLLFAFSAINGYTYSWIYLLVDVIIGFTSFIVFHLYNNNINKLF